MRGATRHGPDTVRLRMCAAFDEELPATVRVAEPDGSTSIQTVTHASFDRARACWWGLTTETLAEAGAGAA